MSEPNTEQRLGDSLTAPGIGTSLKATLTHRNALLLLALLVIGLVFEVLTHDARNSFLSARSLSTVFTQASVIGVLACGMTYLIILNHIDLSVGSALAFVGGLAAWMLAPRREPVEIDPLMGMIDPSAGAVSGLALSPVLVLVAILVIGMLLWGAMGTLQTTTGMPAFIITLGGMMGFRGLAYLIVPREIPIDYEGMISTLGTGNLPRLFGWGLLSAILAVSVLQLLRVRRHPTRYGYLTVVPTLLIGGFVLFLQLYRGVAYLTLLWGGAALVMGYLAGNTVFGRHVYAVGGNAEAARLCGIRVGRVNIIAFVLMGALTALASIMYLGQQGTAESNAGILAELDAIAACVIGGVSLRGGKGTISGAVLGALIMQSLTAGLNQCGVQTGWQMLIKAGVLVIVVALDHILRRD